MFRCCPRMGRITDWIRDGRLARETGLPREALTEALRLRIEQLQDADIVRHGIERDRSLLLPAGGDGLHRSDVLRRARSVAARQSP